MKKKLLLIFTTILLAITALTCNAFADGSGTSGDPWQIGTSGHESDVTAYLDDGTLYVEGSGAMVDFLNGSSMPWYDSRYSITKVIIGEGITRIGDYSFRTHTYLSNIEISSTVTSIGYYSFDNCASNATITVKAVTPPTIAFNSFDPLASFDLNFYVPYYSVSSYQSASNWNQFPNYHAIPLTIADILPDNFPITEATGWTNGNEYIYNFSGYNQIKIGGANHLDLTETLTAEGNNFYVIHQPTSAKIVFIMNDRKFTQIEISGIQAPNDDINGVYVPQSIVASILPANFPNNAETAWINSNYSKKLMLDDGDTVLSAYISGGNKEDLPITTSITKSGNNYYATNTDSTKFTFIMTNDVLTSIIVSNSSKGLNDTYVEPPSIKDMLAKADNFPTHYQQGWTAGKGIRIYVDNYNSVDCLYFYMKYKPTPLGPISEKLSGPNTYEIGDALLTFNIENNVLVSITFSGFTEDGEMLNGTYSKYGLTNYTSSTINYPKGYSGEIILKINASFIEKDGMKIYVDDNLLTSDKYTLSEGSIIITLKPEYVKTISSVPSHTIKINVMNYPDIIATLTFSNKPSGGGSDKHVVLNTGVSSNVLW